MSAYASSASELTPWIEIRPQRRVFGRRKPDRLSVDRAAGGGEDDCARSRRGARLEHEQRRLEHSRDRRDRIPGPNAGVLDPASHEDDVRLFDELVEAVVSDFALEECEPGAGLPRLGQPRRERAAEDVTS